MKRFNIKYNVGKVKYLVSYHDGEKTHKDGSDFFDIATFKNKKELKAFTDDLIKKGYIEGDKLPTAVFIKEITVVDPDTGGDVEVSIYKCPVSGGVFGLDTSYIEQVEDVFNPFGAKLML